MRNVLLFFVICLVLLGSCKQKEFEHSSTKINIDTFPTSTILPKNSVKLDRNLFYYYSLLPIESAEIFYEIPENQRIDLYPASRKDSSSVSIESLDLGNYVLNIILFKKSDAKDVICLIEHLQRKNKISFYTYDIDKKLLLLSEDILPHLDAASFFEDVELEELNGISETPPIYWSLNANQSLKATLYTWMNPAFDGVDVPFDLLLYWENDTFRIEKIRRTDEKEEFDILGRLYGKRKILLGQESG